MKAGEIIRRIKTTEKEVEDVVKQLDARPPAKRNTAASAQDSDGGPTEEDFDLLESDLSDM